MLKSFFHLLNTSENAERRVAEQDGNMHMFTLLKPELFNQDWDFSQDDLSVIGAACFNVGNLEMFKECTRLNQGIKMVSKEGVEQLIDAKFDVEYFYYGDSFFNEKQLKAFLEMGGRLLPPIYQWMPSSENKDAATKEVLHSPYCLMNIENLSSLFGRLPLSYLINVFHEECFNDQGLPIDNNLERFHQQFIKTIFGYPELLKQYSERLPLPLGSVFMFFNTRLSNQEEEFLCQLLLNDYRKRVMHGAAQPTFRIPYLSFQEEGKTFVLEDWEEQFLLHLLSQKLSPKEYETHGVSMPCLPQGVCLLSKMNHWMNHVWFKRGLGYGLLVQHQLENKSRYSKIEVNRTLRKFLKNNAISTLLTGHVWSALSVQERVQKLWGMCATQKRMRRLCHQELRNMGKNPQCFSMLELRCLHFDYEECWEEISRDMLFDTIRWTPKGIENQLLARYPNLLRVEIYLSSYMGFITDIPCFVATDEQGKTTRTYVFKNMLNFEEMKIKYTALLKELLHYWTTQLTAQQQWSSLLLDAANDPKENAWLMKNSYIEEHGFSQCMRMKLMQKSIRVSSRPTFHASPLIRF